MSKRFLTSGVGKELPATKGKTTRKGFARKLPRECPEDVKYGNFRDRVARDLVKLGVKTYYAELSVIDYSYIVSQGWHERKMSETVANAVFERIKSGYKKPMVSDGPSLFAGTK